MYIVLSVGRQARIQEEIRAAAMEVLGKNVSIDHIRNRQIHFGYFPCNAPSLFIMDHDSFSSNVCSDMYRRFSRSYPDIPAIICYQKRSVSPQWRKSANDCLVSYDSMADLRSKLIEMLLCKSKNVQPIQEDMIFPLDQAQTFLRNMTEPIKIRKLQQDFKNHFGNYLFFTSFYSLPEAAGNDLWGDFLYIADEICRKSNKCFMWQVKPHVLMAGFYESASDYANLLNIRDDVIDYARNPGGRDHNKKEVRIQVGCIHSGLVGLIKSYYETAEIDYVDRLYKKSVSFEEISNLNKKVTKPMKLVELERMIRNNMEYRNGTEILDLTKQWFAESRKLGHDLENIQMDLLNLYASIKYVIFDMYTLRETRIKNGWETYEIFKITTIDELEEWFNTWVCYTLNNIHTKHNIHQMRIHDALDFIENHLMEGISLETISGYFFLNPSYFSSMFKKEMKETFISYVTRMKMEKAAELLQRERKVNEVAYLLGYDDLKHFRTVFRKRHGMTPSEYAKKSPEKEKKEDDHQISQCMEDKNGKEIKMRRQ